MRQCLATSRQPDQHSGYAVNLNLAARQIATGSSEIRSASDDLARRTEAQASAIAATAEAQADAATGGAVVERAIAAMTAIEQSSSEIARTALREAETLQDLVTRFRLSSAGDAPALRRAA